MELGMRKSENEFGVSKPPVPMIIHCIKLSNIIEFICIRVKAYRRLGGIAGCELLSLELPSSLRRT